VLQDHGMLSSSGANECRSVHLSINGAFNKLFISAESINFQFHSLDFRSSKPYVMTAF